MVEGASGPSGASGWRPPALAPAATAAIAAVVLLPYAGHLLFGANSAALALLFSGLAAALLLVLLAGPGARRALASRALAVPAALFAAAVLALAAGLTPWAQALRPPSPPGPDLSAGLVELVKLAGAACAFAAGFAVARSDAATRRAFHVLTGAAAAFAAWALVAFLLDPHGIYGFQRVIGGGRLAGAFGSANSAADVLGIGVLVGLAGLMRAADRAAGPGGAVRGLERLALEGWLSALALALSAAALILTASRGGIVSTLAAGLALLLWGAGGREARWLRGLGLGVLALLVGLAARGGELAFARFGLALEDAEVRRRIFAAHWEAFAASPWVGYGAGSFEAVNDAVMTPDTYAVLWQIRAVHNAYLEQLETVGLLGFAALLALVGWPLAAIVRAGADRGRRGGVWLRAVACVALLLGLHGLTDYALQEPSIALAFATLLGLAYAAATRPPPQSAARTAPP